MMKIKKLTHNIQRSESYFSAFEIVRHLQSNGFEATFVGGCVRDGLLNRRIKDVDVATNATPEDVSTLFDSVKLIGASFGVCLVKIEGYSIEVATFRRDGIYTDARRPDSVEYGTMEEDSERRDFTCNGLFFDPIVEELHDFHGGLSDLSQFTLCCIGEAEKRFSEDALRILRAVRFASRFNFQFEEKTWHALINSVPLLSRISAERIRDELTAMICGPYPSRAIRLLQDSGALSLLLPEVEELKDVKQGRRYHPEGDVLTHTLLGLECEPSREPLSRWGILLHDIGKKPTYERSAEGKITFYDHENVGAKMAAKVLKRLRFSNGDVQQISSIVGRHMKFMNAKNWNRSTLRKFVSADTILHDLNVHFADCTACHGMLGAWKYVGEQYQYYLKIAALPDPFITGRDLIDAGFTPSAKFKKCLEQIYDAQLNCDLSDYEDAKRMMLEVMKHV